MGAVLGVLAGYVGWLLINTLVMRTMDIFYAFPAVLLAIAISGALGPGLPDTLISLSIVFIPRVVRVAESATVRGEGPGVHRGGPGERQRRRAHRAHHLLANVLGPILVFASTQVSLSIFWPPACRFLGSASRRRPPSGG